MKILICGDRNWSNIECIRAWLCFLQDWGIEEVIEGEARGADTIARIEAESMGIPVNKFPADWNKFGRAAGPIRNTQMLRERPDLVLAFHNDIQNSKGTKNCIEQAINLGIETLVITEEFSAPKEEFHDKIRSIRKRKTEQNK